MPPGDGAHTFFPFDVIGSTPSALHLPVIGIRTVLPHIVLIQNALRGRSGKGFGTLNELAHDQVGRYNEDGRHQLKAGGEVQIQFENVGKVVCRMLVKMPEDSSAPNGPIK